LKTSLRAEDLTASSLWEFTAARFVLDVEDLFVTRYSATMAKRATVPTSIKLFAGADHRFVR
jgi:hypothetical protein